MTTLAIAPRLRPTLPAGTRVAVTIDIGASPGRVTGTVVGTDAHPRFPGRRTNTVRWDDGITCRAETEALELVAA